MNEAFGNVIGASSAKSPAASSVTVLRMKVAYRPRRPVRKRRGPVTPARASSADSMPLRAAMPACARLIEPPVEAYSVGPLAWLSAMASALKVCASSSPYSRAAVAAAPKLASTACGCQPALSRSGEPRRPMRTYAS